MRFYTVTDAKETRKHDLFVGVIIKYRVTAEKKEVTVAKIAIIELGICAILLGILFKGQNVAFFVVLTFAIAASANFPALLMSITWKKYNTKGALGSMYRGLIVATVLLILILIVWVDIIHKNEKAAVEKEIKAIEDSSKTKSKMPKPIFPLKNPGIYSKGAAFLVGILLSLISREKEAEAKYEDEKLRSYIRNRS